MSKYELYDWGLTFVVFNWINPEEVSINSFLLMDRWLIKSICTYYSNNREYNENLGIVLAYNDIIAWYFIHRCPESKCIVNDLISRVPKDLSKEKVKKAEEFILDFLDWAVVLLYPEMMNENCDYIYDWNEERLLELADFKDKLVLDVGSGTGRLAFAAAKKAKRVYASEPVDILREYMRDKTETYNVNNVVVIDGTVEKIPYEDNTFDIVMSGHVIGDNPKKEIAELTRVTKNGGFIIDCMGDDGFKREKPLKEMLDAGFEYFYHKSKSGGDIYRYRKKVKK